MDIHARNFPETCIFITFKHSVLTNQYFNRVFAFMSSTESHTPKNEEKNTKNELLFDIQKMTISRNFQKQTKRFILN